jgi:hypothetical protein
MLTVHLPVSRSSYRSPYSTSIRKTSFILRLVVPKTLELAKLPAGLFDESSGVRGFGAYSRRRAVFTRGDSRREAATWR